MRTLSFFEILQQAWKLRAGNIHKDMQVDANSISVTKQITQKSYGGLNELEDETAEHCCPLNKTISLKPLISARSPIKTPNS